MIMTVVAEFHSKREGTSMKKITLVMALGFLLQSIPSKSLASGPPTYGTAGVAVAAVLGIGFFGGGDKAGAKAKTGDEFADLNNQGQLNNLLSQQAGGSLNTLDILQ